MSISLSTTYSFHTPHTHTHTHTQTDTASYLSIPATLRSSSAANRPVQHTHSIVGCGVYYYLWIWALPRLRGYRVRQETVVFEDGAQSHKLVKVPVDEVARWDATHDAVGRPLRRTSESPSGSERRGEGEGEKAAAGVRVDDLEK